MERQKQVKGVLIDKLQVAADSSDALAAIDAVVRAVAECHALNDENEYRIRLVSNELLNNIVNHSDADHIEISADLVSGVLRLVIDDNGQGFRYAEIMKQDVTGENCLFQESGRGIFLVRTVSDSFRYNELGNSVEVVLNLN